MHNINILIAEDEAKIQELLTIAIRNVNPSCHIFTAVSVDEGWRIAQENQIHLFIIDFGLVDSDGADLADKVRGEQKYFGVPIIFETIEEKPLLKYVYKFRPVDYIVKPFTIEDIEKRLIVILRVIQESLKSGKYIEIKKFGKVSNVSFEEIVYVSASANKTLIHTTKKVFKCGENLTSVMDKLDIRFTQCHKGYIVNCFYIANFDRSNEIITLKEFTDTIPIGRAYRNAAHEAFIDVT